MNCDRIAPFYQWFENVAFGSRLQRHREAFLQAAAGKRRALILGDGDGRFTAALLRAYPTIEADYLDLSAGMAAQARKRIQAGPNVRLMVGDALGFPFQEARYDIVFTHFFLDCFTTNQVNVLIPRVSKALTSEACWIISDFRQAHRGWRRVYTALWLGTMYFFFRLVTGLETHSLPEYGAALKSAGFAKHKEIASGAGLIASEWWQR